MKHLANFAALALVLLACGCSGKERAIEPSYVGKVEVVRDGAVIGGRDYRCIVREISVSPDRLRVFHVVEKGEEVARLRVYWPTFGLEKQLDAIAKQMAADLEKEAARTPILPEGQRVKVTEAKMSLTKTSDYKLIKHQADRYSLLARGSDDAEHYGFCAESDTDAVEIAVNYVTRFVVPLQIGNYAYERQQLEKAAPKKAPSSATDENRP